MHPIQRFGTALLLGIGTSCSFFFADSASAAEKVVLKYGPFARSVSLRNA